MKKILDIINNYYTFSNYYLKKKEALFTIFIHISLRGWIVLINSIEKNCFKNYIFLSLFFIYAQ